MSYNYKFLAKYVKVRKMLKKKASYHLKCDLVTLLNLYTSILTLWVGLGWVIDLNLYNIFRECQLYGEFCAIFTPQGAGSTPACW